jgi:hypothetical protein
MRASEWTSSKRLAALIGPTLTVVAGSEILNARIWTERTDPAIVYLSGSLLFAAGLSIVRAHNIWRGWPVVITLVGWLALVGGTIRMVFPRLAQHASHATNGATLALRPLSSPSGCS